jgi:hypothetical protein
VRESVTAQETAIRLFQICTDVQDLWPEVKRLPPCSASPLIACCEMMWARLGLGKFMVGRSQQEPIALSICEQIDVLLGESLGGSGDEETLAFYGVPLLEAAHSWIDFYRTKAHLPLALAASIMFRLEGPADSPAEVSRTFNRFGNRLGATLSALRIRKD